MEKVHIFTKKILIHNDIVARPGGEGKSFMKKKIRRWPKRNLMAPSVCTLIVWDIVQSQ